MRILSFAPILLVARRLAFGHYCQGSVFAAVASVCLLDPTRKAASSPRKAVAVVPLPTMPYLFCFASRRWSVRVKAGHGLVTAITFVGEMDTLAIQSPFVVDDVLLLVMMVVKKKK